MQAERFCNLPLYQDAASAAQDIEHGAAGQNDRESKLICDRIRRMVCMDRAVATVKDKPCAISAFSETTVYSDASALLFSRAPPRSDMYKVFAKLSTPCVTITAFHRKMTHFAPKADALYTI